MFRAKRACSWLSCPANGLVSPSPTGKGSLNKTATVETSPGSTTRGLLSTHGRQTDRGYGSPLEVRRGIAFVVSKSSETTMGREDDGIDSGRRIDAPVNQASSCRSPKQTPLLVICAGFTTRRPATEFPRTLLCCTPLRIHRGSTRQLALFRNCSVSFPHLISHWSRFVGFPRRRICIQNHRHHLFS